MAPYKIKVKQILRDEKINTFGMTLGFSSVAEIPHQIFLCKKKEIKEGPFILYPKKAYPKYSISEIGKKYSKKITKTQYDVSYIAFIDSIYSFNVNQEIFNKLFQQKYFCLWHPSEPVKYYGKKEIGYIPFFRTFKLTEKICKDLIEKSQGFKGRYVITNLEDEIEVILSDPVLSNSDFNHCKSAILEIINKCSGNASLKIDNSIEVNQIVNIICAQDIFADIKEFEKSNKGIPETQKETLVQSRIGQGKFRSDLIDYWKCCAVTGCHTAELLKASHIKPWRDCDNIERLDQYNGLLLSPNIDAAFDSGLISFDDDGKILISSKLNKEEAQKIGYHSKLRILNLSKKHLGYLEHHRNNVFQGSKRISIIAPSKHEDIYQNFENWRGAVGPQNGWGLAWMLAYEFCKRFYSSHGIVPRVIEHEGLGYYGIGLYHTPCGVNPNRTECIGRFTMGGDVENWITGSPSDHGLLLTERLKAGEPLSSLLFDALRHMDIPTAPPRPHASCYHNKLGKQYEFVFHIATIIALRNDGIIQIWNDDHQTSRIAMGKDSNFNNSELIGYFLFQHMNKQVVISGDGRTICPSENDSLWDRYMRGVSPYDLAMEIEKELSL